MRDSELASSETILWRKEKASLAERKEAAEPTLLTVSRLEKKLIDEIRRQGELTKAELIARTDSTRAKVNAAITGLLKKGYIQTTGAGDYTGGRRSIKYSLNGGKGLVAGVDIGATSINILIADIAGRPFARRGEAASVREGPQQVLGRVCELLKEMLAEDGLLPEQLSGIGIGVPGPVDFELGRLISPPIMPGWNEFPIIELVQSHFAAANVSVDNDVNVMAMGEAYHGKGIGIDNMVFVKIGTGIGAGVICGGEIYRGANGCAGDIGHISIQKSGPLCSCGNQGCLESLAAGPAIAERAARAALDGSSSVLLRRYEANGGLLRAEDVGLAAAEGDPAALEIIRSSGQMLGEVLASLVNFFNPSMIVLGGGVSNIGNQLLASVRQAVLRRSTPLATRDLRILYSATGADAGVIGAISLAVDAVFAVEGRVGVH